MGYPQMPQYGPGVGMPVRPVSGTTKTFAEILGTFFAVCVVVYVGKNAKYVDVIDGGPLVAYMLISASLLAALAGVLMLVVKARAGSFVLPAGVALFYVGWLIIVAAHGGAALKMTFSKAGWDVGLAPGLIFGAVAALLCLLPPTQAHLAMWQRMKMGGYPVQLPYPPTGPQGYPAQGAPLPPMQPGQPGPHGYAPPMGQPPMGQPPMGQPQQYPGQPPQHPGQPRQW